MITNTKTQEEIEKAVAEFDELSEPWFNFPDYTKKRIVDFWIKKLEHLAKQKDEEFMGMIGEDEDTTGGVGHGNMFRNALRSELRNKLQGGGK